MTRATGKVNPTYALDERDRLVVALLVELRLWSYGQIARAYRIDRRTVTRCAAIFSA